jgi:hypothetical protein
MPAQLRSIVLLLALVWSVYSTFAGIAKPKNIPAAGQVAGIDKLPDALQEMHAYCSIPWPGA